MKKNEIKIIVGLMMVVFVIVGYLPEPQYLVELTCISNLFGGLLLITDGIRSIISGKEVKTCWYLMDASALFLVFMICMISLTGIFHFNFAGAFFFLHVINPIAFFLCYLFLKKETKEHKKYILCAPGLTCLYMIFDYLIGQLRGSFVYGFVTVEELNFLYAVIVLFIIYVIVCIPGTAFFFGNCLLHKNKGEDKSEK